MTILVHLIAQIIIKKPTMTLLNDKVLISDFMSTCRYYYRSCHVTINNSKIDQNIDIQALFLIFISLSKCCLNYNLDFDIHSPYFVAVMS